MALPKEPRQKMINIMYLVLTALLALNVSVQILNAFIAVNTGLVTTNKNFDEKNASYMDQFQNKLKADAQKTLPFLARANNVRKWSKELCDYIDTLKKELISETDHLPMKTADTTKLININAKDNFDIPTHILINDAAAEDGSKGKAHDLKMKMADFRKNVITMINGIKPQDTALLNIGLLTKNVPYSKEWEKHNVTWEVDNFYERPLVAEICLLSKIQNDVKNTEATMLQYLLSAITAKDIAVSDFKATIIPVANYVTLGDSFKADIFATAVIKTAQPKIVVGDVDTNTGAIKGHVDSVKVSGGTGKYAVRTDHEGPVKVYGSLMVKGPDGALKKYPFETNYIVAKPSAVVSPTKMNVFFIGVDNPVEISAPGVAAENLRPAGSGCSLSGSKGKYTVRVSGGDKCSISVEARMPDGSNKNMGKSDFRIARVPPPTCYVAGKSGDIIIPKGQLLIATQVMAKLDNFYFDLSYVVTSYTVAVSVNGINIEKNITGNLFTPDIKKLFQQCPSGSHIIVENVHVKGPDGSKTIPGVNIKIN